MNCLSVERLAKRYGPRELFKDVSFGLERGQKTAIVARNGTGKSTLLKCIAGLEKADDGIISFNKGLRVGYLDQNVAMSASHSLVDEMLDQDDPVTNAIRAYEHAVAREAEGDDLHRAIDRMEELKAWDHEARVRRLLFQFGLRDLEQPVNTLSGGQQKRLGMAKVLINLPDVLILDEPTNHLDLQMIEQLEDELGAPNVTLLLVTHDRHFLDNVCDEIIEMEFGQFTRFKGNYSYYVEKKALLDDVRDATQQHLKGLMRSELEWVRKMPRARGTKSKSRLSAFDTLKEEATRDFSREQVSIEVQTTRLGGKVIEARNLTKRFGDKPIVEHFNYSLKSGDRIGIVGPNGIGKSTFVDLLTKRIEPDMGKVTIGDTVVLGIFGQQGLILKEDKRIVDVVRDIAEVIPLNKGRTLTASQLLERFLFDKEQQYNYASTLSGGERRRLHLCTVLMQNPNVLFLDEPTNDLDIPTLNALESFLTELDICLLIVSHDRFFMDKLCTKLLVFEGDGVIKEWVSSYTELRDMQKLRAARPVVKVAAPKTSGSRSGDPEGTVKTSGSRSGDHAGAGSKKMTFGERNELKKLDKEMPALETKKEELIATLAKGGTDHHEIMRLSLALEQAVHELDRMGERWLLLMEKFEAEAK